MRIDGQLPVAAIASPKPTPGSHIAGLCGVLLEGCAIVALLMKVASGQKERALGAERIVQPTNEGLMLRVSINVYGPR